MINSVLLPLLINFAIILITIILFLSLLLLSLLLSLLWLHYNFYILSNLDNFLGQCHLQYCDRILLPIDISLNCSCHRNSSSSLLSFLSHSLSDRHSLSQSLLLSLTVSLSLTVTLSSIFLTPSFFISLAFYLSLKVFLP